MSEGPAPKRRWFRFGLLAMFVAVTAVACVAYLYTLLPNELTPAELKSIQLGMTESEVIALVGRPDIMKTEPDGTTWWWYGRILGESIVFKNGRVVQNERF